MPLQGESEPFLKDPTPCTPRRPRWAQFLPQDTSHYSWQSLRNLTFSPFFSHFIVFSLTSLVWTGALLLVLTKALLPLDHRATATAVAGTSRVQYGINITTTARFLSCGRTTAEAKQRGCTYDILSNHWVPGICMDEAAVAEYQADGTWFGFADEARRQRLTIAAMSEHDYYYTNERDHIVHCAILWRKQFRAFFAQRQNLDSIIASEEHTMHCSQFLMDMADQGPDYRNMPIKTFVGHTGCWVRD
ncbi:hypothetical protein C8A01DRAFT_20320 [Parachaetomium inaequale]|uniref:Uncharacterized protein n=1 Tax=Parachaetomium inaequale TaxID=2588326 RepID=A0AAN6P6E2_9PEZI|nr:hypothetical protein C8A01DRAFT_20320 [Parachaetomium inaequale]